MTLRAHPAAAEPAPALVMRACSCDSEPAGEKCDACEEAEAHGAQASLWLSHPRDPAEREADGVADAVMAMTTPAARPISVRAPTVAGGRAVATRRAAAPGPAAAPPQVAAAVASGGRPLPAGERHFFERRFGHDFSAVRIHTGPAASRAAQAIGARAYALGTDIAFDTGQFAPGSPAGRHLIAHELTHTLQQGSARTVRRTCPSDPADIPAGTAADFETRADAALAHASYRRLDTDGKQLARHIIDGARGSACPMYYIEKLHVLFATTRKAASEQATEARTATAAAEAAETTRLQDPVAAADVGIEEAAAADAGRRWTTRTGRDGVRFRVDRGDPNNMVVQMRVRLRPAGVGTREDVARTRALEDAIEKAGSTRGYMLDVVFTNAGGGDVFTVGVDPKEWTTSGNWVGDPQEIAHEAHHLLGLDDRYNYIEGHAGNAGMDMGTRLYWFREQMVRPLDPLASTSLMEDHTTGPMNDEDVCAVAGGDFRTCLDRRLDGVPIDELEDRGRALNSPYRPQHAAHLRLLSDAWQRKGFTEIMARCANQSDPLCGLPPSGAFGDPNITAGDSSRFPLANPHRQLPGSSLRRQRRQP